MKKTLFALGLVACTPAAQPTPAPAAPNYGAAPPGYAPYAPAPAYPQYPTQPAPYAAPGAPPATYVPPAAPAPAPPASPVASRPLLPPLVGGSLAWQAEVRAVLAEDMAALSAENQARVQGIPLIFDPSLDINAYASCDAQGKPAITGTEGLLEAVDAIAQTRACDELYGTQTYPAYASAVIPALTAPGDASPMLPPTILPAQCLSDPRRWSRAHEWFDEIVAFTFGHELSHHYLGHTGCANGSPAPFSGLAQLMSAGGHMFAQPLENLADVNGADNTLDAGVARSRAGQYRWTEEGGLALLDFFKRLETSVPPGQQVFVAFVGNHPPSGQRIFWVQQAVNIWHLQHPG